MKILDTGPLSPGQQERWLMACFDEHAAVALNEQFCLRLRGVVDLDALQRAVGNVLDSHRAFRIGFDEASPVQRHVRNAPAPHVTFSDLSACPAPDDALVEHCRIVGAEPFDLAHPPLARVYLVRLRHDEHVLHLVVSHLIFDGWAAATFARDVARSYRAALIGDTASANGTECPITFASAVSELFESEQGAGQRQHIADRLLPLPPVPALPDRAPPDDPRYSAGTHVATFPDDQCRAFREACKRERATPFQGLLAVLGAAISRLSSVPEFVVNVPYAAQLLVDADSVIGDGVLDLLVRIPGVPEGRPIEAVLPAIRRELAEAAETPLATQGAIARVLGLPTRGDAPAITPIFFNLNPPIDLSEFAPLAASFFEPERAAIVGDLFFSFYDLGDGYRLYLHFNAERFSRARIAEIVQCFARSLAEFAGLSRVSQGASATVTVGPVPTLRPGEVCRGNEAPIEGPLLVDVLVDHQASLRPGKIAIECGGETFSYAELLSVSDSVAGILRARGVRHGDRVGVHLERGVHLVPVLVGIWKCGAAYVPLDPGFPRERLDFMVQDACLTLVITGSAQAGGLGVDPARRVLLEEVTTAPPQPIAGLPAERARDGSDPAYVIYTSGSTGLPKGVVIPHRALCNFLESMRRAPGLSSKDRLLAVTTLSFDIAVLELFLPLCTGGTVVIASREDSVVGDSLAALIAHHSVSVMQATPTTWNLLIDAGWQAPVGFRALCGGEPLPLSLARSLLAMGCELWNMYGPTETTVWSTTARIAGDPTRITIGRPIDNTGIWILDESLKPLPAGSIGELCISGQGLALGYFRHDALTRGRFLELPGEAPGQSVRVYRTGDLARVGPDGELEHHGRVDQQVKLRGFRIELGEIEAALESIAAIARAATALAWPGKAEARLISFVQRRTGEDAAATTEDALVGTLRRFLPNYMIPSRILAVPELPLLPNGKIDRRALQALAEALPAGEDHGRRSRPTIASGYSSDRARDIAAAMAQVLEVNAVGPQESFFELGGHSLSAVRLAALLEPIAGHRPGLKQLFRNPTPEMLAQALGGDAGSAAPASSQRIASRGGAASGPLSRMQQRVLFLELLSPGTPMFNMPSLHLLRGQVDPGAFRTALLRVIERQPALRTVFAEGEDGWQQRILPVAAVSETLGWYAPEADVAASWTRFDERVREAIARPYDLRAGPLFTAFLQSVSATETAFFFQAHHLIWDAWSFDLLYAELAHHYAAALAGAPQSTEALTVDYLDFSDWQQRRLQGAELERLVDYWGKSLAPLPPPAELPLASRRPDRPSGRGGSFQVEMPRRVVDRLRVASQRHGATLFSSLFAAFALVLHRSTGQDELVIGAPIRGREQPGLEQVMGFFVEVLPLRSRYCAEMPLADWVLGFRDAIVEGFGHPDVPVEELVAALGLDRARSRSPLFQTAFSFQDVRERITRWGPLQHSRLPTPVVGAQQDLGVWCVETRDCLELVFSFDADILDEPRTRLLAARLCALIERMADSFDRRLADCDVLSDEELGKLAEWNATGRAFDERLRFSDLFARQVAARPDAMAASYPGCPPLTYAQLAVEVGETARMLAGHSLGPGARVGLHLERGLDYLVAQLAALELGASYVPLDPALPAERLEFMVKDADCALVLTHSSLASRQVSEREKVVFLDLAREHPGEGARRQAPPVASGRDPLDVAYVLYTSGSTGVPKGVAVPHRALTNFLLSMAREPGMGPGDRIVAVTTPSFDISALELLLPLTVGAHVVVAPFEVVADGQALRRFLEQHRPTMLQATPTLWQMLLEAGWSPASGLKALCGGEPLPPDLAARLLAHGVELWNMYGPTETTVWSTCERLDALSGAISIGRPIENTQVAIVDARGALCGLGVVGEVLIGGAGVARGYVGRDDETVEKFVACQPGPLQGGRWYRTGDLGRWLPRGALEHLGRRDSQVKVRGYRIELTEIESRLRAMPGVQDAVAAVKTVEGGPMLVAYYRAPQGAFATDALLAHCRATLPVYMIPQMFVRIDEVPCLPNGKVDRARLPQPREAAHVPPAPRDGAALSGSAGAIADIWSRVLQVERVASGDNFFDLGGRSLLAMRAALEITRKLGVEVTVRQLIFDTLADIAHHVDRATGGAAGGSPAGLPRARPWRQRLLAMVGRPFR